MNPREGRMGGYAGPEWGGVGGLLNRGEGGP